MSSRINELKALFTSGARVRVLSRLLLCSGDRFYQSEMARLDGLPVKAVQRELAKLIRFGLVRRAGRGGRHRYYRANLRHSLYLELKAIFLKTILLGSRPERLKQPPFSGIRVAFVFGSVARAEEDSRSDIDILVVGSVTSAEWSRAVRDSRLLDFREENSIVMPEGEFRDRLGRREEFLAGICGGPKIFLIGGEDDLKRLGEEAKASASGPDT